MAKITDLKRNDKKAALKLALERNKKGQLEPDVIQQLAMLQDNALGFLDELDELLEGKSTK